MSFYAKSSGVENYFFFLAFVAHYILIEIAFLCGFFIHGSEILVRG